MKILSGAYKKDSGTVFIDNKEVSIENPHDSKQLGIGIIYQEFSLIPDLSVAENIFINQFGSESIWLKRREIEKKAKELIENLGFDITPSAKVRDLSIAHQQIVEISKSLVQDVKILILDEPSAVLAPNEINTLFEILYRLKEEGTAIIYITHRLDEVFKLADCVTVLRGGISSSTYKIEEIDQDKIIQLMLGRRLDTLFPPHKSKIGEKLLEAKNISVPGKVRNISLSVSSGEILGIAGLVGSGRTETLQALFAANKFNAEKVELSQKALNLKSPHQAVKQGIGMVPEDRKTQGIIGEMSIKENISLTNYGSISGKLRFIHAKKEKHRILNLMNTLGIKAQDESFKAANLSGGNQQKIVLAKWLNRDCKVLLIDEPTRGVDIGAKVEIYNEICKLSEKGLGIIIVSSETTELLGLCNRILVMRDGVLKGELQKDQFSEENVLRLAFDQSKIKESY